MEREGKREMKRVRDVKGEREKDIDGEREKFYTWRERQRG
jgi:hypothetical protein